MKAIKAKKWNVYHYNAIAKEIRELFPLDEPNDKYLITKITKNSARTTLTALALSLANRFYHDWQEADEGIAFDPKKFLNRCSPDTNQYPLEELWQ